MGLLLRKRSQDDGASFSERLSSSPSEQPTQVWSMLPCSSLEHLCPELRFPCSSWNRLFLVTRARLSLPPSRLTETHRASHVTWGQAPPLSLPQRPPLCPGVRLPAGVHVGSCLTQAGASRKDLASGVWPDGVVKGTLSVKLAVRLLEQRAGAVCGQHRRCWCVCVLGSGG